MFSVGDQVICTETWHSTLCPGVDYGQAGHEYKVAAVMGPPYNVIQVVGLGEDDVFKRFGQRAWLEARRFEKMEIEHGHQVFDPRAAANKSD